MAYLRNPSVQQISNDNWEVSQSASVNWPKDSVAGPRHLAAWRQTYKEISFFTRQFIHNE